MPAKRVRLSDDETNYYTLPGNSAEVRDEAGQLTDTIFGQPSESTETGLLTWMLNSQAFYKGFAGYIVKLMKGGEPQTMTGEAMSLVSGKTYVITNTAKQLIDVDTTVTVLDNAVDHTADVENIDFLFGKVTFKSSYTVTGPVTITGKYVALTAIAGARTFTLTQTATANDNTDIPDAKSNGGWRTFETDSGLKSVSLEIGGIFKSTNDFRTALQTRSKVYIEINPDNSNLSVARGLMKYAGRSQSGDVGALEQETITLRLHVPEGDIWKVPFAWNHSALTKLSRAVRIALAGWESGADVFVEYLYDGTNGFTGPAVVTDISLRGGLESMNEFTVALQGSGAPTAVP
jgi:predicted secreted protein